MSKAEWEKLYRDAWQIYYTPEHIETILRRAQAYEINILRLAQIVLWFSASLAVEKACIRYRAGILPAHQSSRAASRACRSSRCGDFILGSSAISYSKPLRHRRLAWRIFRIYRRVAADAHLPYTDQAMTPVTEDETDTLELFTHNKSAREAVDHARKVKTLTGATPAVVESTA